jgi:hypothetical protein
MNTLTPSPIASIALLTVFLRYAARSFVHLGEHVGEGSQVNKRKLQFNRDHICFKQVLRG